MPHAGRRGARRSAARAVRGRPRGLPGIPYAAPPVGDLRWRPARPHAGWDGVREAAEYGPSAPQPVRADPVLGGHGAPPLDEDCLTLNVWTPATDTARRPVLVWIHGGGFVSGSGTLPIYAGDTFARDGDLVVVSISYRIGALGYVYLGPDDDADGGNFWLTDQLAALRWVRENIAAFGGDPDDVTVAGQSGGAFSTAALAVHPEGRRLFHRAILQSPPFGVATPDPEESLRTTAALLEVAGVADVAELRALPWERLVEATIGMFGVRARWGQWPVPFLPVVDGSTLTRNPVEALIAGENPEIEILLGWTGNEAGFAFGANEMYTDATHAEVRGRFVESFGERGAEAYDVFAAAHPDASALDLLTDLVSDELFRLPSVALAEARAEHGRPAWVYQFDYATPAYDGRLGAAHCLELPFSFRNADRWSHAPFLAGVEPKTLDGLGAAMHDAWISFIRTGDPNHAGLPTWERYTAPNRATMLFDATNTAGTDPVGPAKRRLYAEGDGGR
ncbi:carboxylesterase/lipase family protein [Embleya sp. NBC_00896]|uniref:carboxylesterase/lipase family protein n=1 Tax=Embleya sp. NBC_00896 TaxID=2975961 RepID=UPI003869B74A|nr:carboxylesterase family protein [Embleya sp. NBC_00896]